jgi:hypothetical protein
MIVRPHPDAGDPDAGDPDAGDPDAGDPDAGGPLRTHRYTSGDHASNMVRAV